VCIYIISEISHFTCFADSLTESGSGSLSFAPPDIAPSEFAVDWSAGLIEQDFYLIIWHFSPLLGVDPHLFCCC
jgi:hypothetical protein